MPVTARRHALRDHTRPSNRRHIGLATMETLLTLVWTLLLGAVSRLLTGFYLYLLPLQYIISASMVAWLESPVSASRTNPLTAFGLVEASRSGRAATQWQTLVRIMLTPPLLLCAMVGFVPLLNGRRSLPEVLSGTRIVPLNPALDPRSPVAIRRAENRIRVMVRSYTVFSLAIAGLILLVPVRFESILDTPPPAREDSGLSDEDQRLLEIYLDISTRNPDEVEYHVRLASLYYRNGMEEDLQHELSEVRRLDPDHAILILDNDFEEEIGSVFPEPDTTAGEAFLQLQQPVYTQVPAPADSADSAATGPDSLGAPSGYAVDSLVVTGAPPMEEHFEEDTTETFLMPEITPAPEVIVPGPAPSTYPSGGGETEEEEAGEAGTGTPEPTEPE